MQQPAVWWWRCGKNVTIIHIYTFSGHHKRDSSDCIVLSADSVQCLWVQSVQWLDYRLGDVGFNSWQGKEIFVFSKTCRQALMPTQPPIKLVPGGKMVGHEADHSPLSSARVKNEWSYTSPSPVCLLIMCRDNLIFIFYRFCRWIPTVQSKTLLPPVCLNN
jgi:hypothetical protein